MVMTVPSLSFIRAVPLPIVLAAVVPLIVDRVIVTELSMKSKNFALLRMVSSA